MSQHLTISPSEAADRLARGIELSSQEAVSFRSELRKIIERTS